MKFQDKIIESIVDKLLNGRDYRTDVLNYINTMFFDFTMDFFKAIVDRKFQAKGLTIDWYKQNFIMDSSLNKDDIAWNAGTNIKTINNIYNSTSRKIIIDMAQANYDYLKNILSQLEQDPENDLAIKIKITKNEVSVELTLTESLLVINALATRKIALRGGAWSAIGKSVEKPLLIKLCKLTKVYPSFYNADKFIKDKTKDVDREIDFILIDRNGHEYKCEVKLMGKGNPESADAVIARDSDVFIADTLSKQNKNQLNNLGILWLELKNHYKRDIVAQFKKIIDKLNIPHG